MSRAPLPLETLGEILFHIRILDIRTWTYHFRAVIPTTTTATCFCNIFIRNPVPISKGLLTSFTDFKIGRFVLFLSWKSYLYILNTSLIRYMVCKYFLPFCGSLSFCFLAGVLWNTNIFNFDVQFICFFLWLLVLLVQGYEYLYLCYLLRVIKLSFYI